MTAFSECFNAVRKRRKLNCAELARVCEMDAAIVYKWSKSVHIPQSWTLVEQMMDTLHLTEGERKQMRSAYEKTLLGETKYEANQRIAGLLRMLQRKREEYAAMESVRGQAGAILDTKARDFTELRNRTEILQCIQKVLHDLEMQKKVHLRLKLHAAHRELAVLLQMFYSRVEVCTIEQISCFMNGHPQADAYNFQVMKALIELLFQKHPAQLYYCEIEGQEESSRRNWLISDDAVIEFADDFSNGMVTTNPDLIAHCSRRYEEMKRTSRAFIEGEVVEAGKGSCCNYLGYMPAPLHFFKEKKAGKEPREFPFNIFCKEGLVQFLETGRHELVPSQEIEAMSLQERCQWLEQVLEADVQEKISCYMLKDGLLPDLGGIYLWQNGGRESSVNVVICLADGSRRSFAVTAYEIEKSFRSFWKSLKNSMYVFDE